jgi:hypothetical protein
VPPALNSLDEALSSFRQAEYSNGYGSMAVAKEKAPARQAFVPTIVGKLEIGETNELLPA